MFLLLSLSFLNFTSTLWAKGVTSAKSLPAPGAGQLQAGFEVLDGNRAMTEVHVFNRQSQRLADPAAKPKQYVNEEPISEVGSFTLKQVYLVWFKIGFHYFLLLPLMPYRGLLIANFVSFPNCSVSVSGGVGIRFRCLRNALLDPVSNTHKVLSSDFAVAKFSEISLSTKERCQSALSSELFPLMVSSMADRDLFFAKESLTLCTLRFYLCDHSSLQHR